MILGFTGTRQGMTEQQRFAVSEFLDERKPTETHSGDCKGADSQFLDAALLCNGNSPPRTHGHPCSIEKWRAFRRYNSLHPVKNALARNQDIVDASDELLAAPKSSKNSDRVGGTWDTIRKALKAKKTVTVVWPDGTKNTWGYTSLAEIFGVN
jgi:hypothetical protein